MCLRDKKSKRINSILEKNFESLEVDFNLTHLILDFRERQRANILEKMKSNFHDRFMAHHHAKENAFADAADETAHKKPPGDDHLYPSIPPSSHTQSKKLGKLKKLKSEALAKTVKSEAKLVKID